MKKWILYFLTGVTNLIIKNCHLKNSILLFSKIRIEAGNVMKAYNAEIKRTFISITGKNNEISINGLLDKATIKITGCNCNIIIGKNAALHDTTLIINGTDCTFRIGEKSTIGGAYMVCMGKNNYITIGDECMFAENIDIWASDSHPIFNSCGNAINQSRPIVVGNHVWIGKHAKIMKGVVIGDNSIIGMCTVVTKDIPSGTLNVGIPSRIIKEKVNWDRSFIKC